MPLILTLDKGESFFLRDIRKPKSEQEDIEVVVDSIHRNHHFVLKTPDGTCHEIVQDRMAEVWPETFVSSGTRSSAALARIVISAPEEIKIRRSQKLRLS